MRKQSWRSGVCASGHAALCSGASLNRSSGRHRRFCCRSSRSDSHPRDWPFSATCTSRYDGASVFTRLKPLLRRVGRSGAPGTPDAVTHGSAQVCAQEKSQGLRRDCEGLQAHKRPVVLLEERLTRYISHIPGQGRLHGLSGAADADLQ